MHAPSAIDQLAHALYGLSVIRRDLQRCAGLEHAAGALATLGALRRLGAARISDVAAELHVNVSVASRQLQALEGEGLVDRVADPHDGRSSLVELSPAGVARLDAAHDRLLGAVEHAVEGWDATQIAGLATGIVRLRAALSRPADTTLPAAPAAADPHAPVAPAVAATPEEPIR